MPFTSPGTFEGKSLYKGGPTSLIAPQGVTDQGRGARIARPGAAHQRASIYQTTAADYKLEIEGTGSLQRGQEAESDGAERSANPVRPAEGLQQADVGTHVWPSAFWRWASCCSTARAAVAAPVKGPGKKK